MIAFRETPELVRRTLKERGYTAQVLLDESGDITGRVYGVFGPPTVYFVDRRGNLVGRLVGARDWGSPAARKFVGELLEMKESRPARGYRPGPDSLRCAAGGPK